jgi:hypothetical protein
MLEQERFAWKDTVFSMSLHIPPSPWLSSATGRSFLEKRVALAVQAFEESGLEQTISDELSAALTPQSRDFRIARSLRHLTTELSILCAGEKYGITIPPQVWMSVEHTLLGALSGIDEINFQGRGQPSPWKSDLTTAEVGAWLALALNLDEAGKLPHAELRSVIEEKCLRPVLADWLDHETRIHALDTMGHNWWAVMVGCAGIMAVALDDEDLSPRIATVLTEWFHYEGNDFARKRRNFGEDGDFVESFHYADYALYYPIAFSKLYPAFRLVPDGLNERQLCGLAAWLKGSILPVADGYPQQRFGDIQFYDGFMSIVWQTVARLANDPGMLEAAYRVRPDPYHLLEILFWEPQPQPLPTPAPVSTLSIYPNSGIAFLHERSLRLTVRAGEFWGHNHLDAGSFIYHQDGETWIDDSGACDYGRTEYVGHYVSAVAHNVAYAPDLTPPTGQAFYEGMPDPARYLCHASHKDLKVVCADTGILSGGALARSHRWLFAFSDEAALIWDDLAAYQDQRFAFLLHTPASVEPEEDTFAQLHSHGKTCALSFYSDAPCHQTVEPSPLGQLSSKGEKPIREKDGRAITWTSEPARRLKFGLVLSTRSPKAEWQTSPDGGTECTLALPSARWRIWFNPRADGRVMHENAIATWNDLETDAYALILREEIGGPRICILQGSFLRRGGEVLFGSLTKRALATVELPA